MPAELHITEAQVRLIRIPLETPHGDAIQNFTALEVPMVTLISAEGRKGVGFGYTIGNGGTAIVELLRRELLPKLEGKDARRIAEINWYLTQSIHALTPGCLASTALAAIDIALWDLFAKTLNQPLHIILGGAKTQVPIYNTQVGWLNRPLNEMLALCKEAVKRDHFKAVKLKVGKPDPLEDLERVGKVRETLGESITIMLDANQSWSLDQAKRILPRLEKFNPYWIEEPLPATDRAGFRRLAEVSTIPRAGGESLYSMADFYECLRDDCLDILQPDLSRVGGITNTMKVCHLAETAGVKVAPHVSPELAVVVAAAVPNSIYVEYIPQMEIILSKKLSMRDGMALPFDSPGHGIAFDPDALNKFEVNT